MKASALWFLSSVPIALVAQALNPSPRVLVNAARPLVAAEVAAVLTASRQAIDGKACRLSYGAGGPGPEVLMRSDGRPRFMRLASGVNVNSASISASGDGTATRRETQSRDDLINFIDYTGRPARRCDGSVEPGELVIEYEHRRSTNTWTAKARLRTPMEVGAPIFDALAGVTRVTSGERKQVGGRWARAFAAPWTLPPGAQPGGPLPAGATQTLWIDVESLLPLRWGVSIPPAPERGMPAIPDYGLSFTCDASIDVRPPDGVTPPDCIR